LTNKVVYITRVVACWWLSLEPWRRQRCSSRRVLSSFV